MGGGVKALILLLVLVGGCASTPVNPNWVSDPSDRNNVKIEKEIRWRLENPEGELTKADLEKVKNLYLRNNQLTDVTALKELTQLTELYLDDNPDLTKAQIDELKKALPNCKINSDITK